MNRHARRWLTLGLAAVVAAASSATAFGMTNLATPDGDQHPAVVALMRVSDDGELARHFCSGTALSATVVVTASHCTFGASASPPGLLVTNDPSLDADPSGWVQIGSLQSKSRITKVHTNPLYYSQVREDVSAVEIEPTLTGITETDFPVLPTAGYLATLSAKQLRATPFTVLGYGRSEGVTGSGGVVKARTNERRFAMMFADALSEQVIHQSQKIAKGEPGACNGDSGGPSFIASGGVQTIVGVTSSGDTNCFATNTASRIDRPSVLAFLQTILVGS